MTRYYFYIAIALSITPVSPLAAGERFPLSVPDALGVNIHFTDPKPGEMQMLAAGGFHWVRMDFHWGSTEREKGQYDFGAFDRLLAALEPHKIRALLILDYSNRLYDQGLSPHSDEGRQAFARWAAAAAAHFRGRGILWEMYNEPNIGFWKPKPNVQDYIRLALEVGKALRAAAPDEAYIGPATSQIDLDFLEECFRAGLLNYWSAVSVHPYRQKDPETSGPEYSQLRRLIARYAPPGKTIPILSAEWGYSTGWAHFDDARQARMLARQWLSNLAFEVPLSIWYDWHDDGTNPKDPEHHFGSVLNKYFSGRDPVYDPKPAWLAAKTLSSVLGGFRFSKRIMPADARSETADSPAWILLFDRGPEVRLAAWTTGGKDLPVGIPCSPGKFRVLNHTGDKQNGVSCDKAPLPLVLTDAPQYLIPEAPNDLLRIAAAWQRAPQEIHEPAGGEKRLPLVVRNPLGRPIRVARVAREPQNPMEVLPGQQFTLDEPYRILRAAGTTSPMIGLDVQGLGRLSQQTTLSASNPLSVAVLPLSRDAISLQLLNPSGDAFSGRVKLEGVAGLKIEGSPAQADLSAGCFQRLVRFALQQPPVAEYRFSVVLEDAMGGILGRPTAVCCRLLDDFAKYAPATLPDAYRIAADGDRNVACEQTLALADPPEGPLAPGLKSLRITYRFDPGWKFLRLVPKAGPLPIDADRKVGFWLHADGTRCHVRLRFVDSTGQTFQPAGTDVKWTGWRYVEIPLDGHDAGHWGGANDGVIHKPLRWDTLLLVDRDRKSSTQGTLYVASPLLMGP